MEPNRSLFADCALKVQADYHMGGLAGGMYEGFAWDVMLEYTRRRPHKTELEKLADWLAKETLYRAPNSGAGRALEDVNRKVHKLLTSG
jgi:hypothetical protein